MEVGDFVAVLVPERFLSSSAGPYGVEQVVSLQDVSDGNGGTVKCLVMELTLSGSTVETKVVDMIDGIQQRGACVNELINGGIPFSEIGIEGNSGDPSALPARFLPRRVFRRNVRNVLLWTCRGVHVVHPRRSAWMITSFSNSIHSSSLRTSCSTSGTTLSRSGPRQDLPSS